MGRIYFTDSDLGKRFPATLAASGRLVERHDQIFDEGGLDEEWLEYCGTRDRIVLTHNERIRYVPNELAAVVRHRVKLIVVNGKAPLPLLAEGFVATLPKIEKFLQSHTPPFIAKVYRPTAHQLVRDPSASGTIELWYPK